MQVNGEALQTGASKHYAFIEFENATTAEIVADTMDNYLLLGHLLKCKIIPSEQVHPRLWIGANKKFKRSRPDIKAREAHNAVSCHVNQFQRKLN